MKQYLIEGQMLFGLRKTDNASFNYFIKKEISKIEDGMVHFKDGIPTMVPAIITIEEGKPVKLGDVVATNGIYNFYRSQESRFIGAKRDFEEMKGSYRYTVLVNHGEFGTGLFQKYEEALDYAIQLGIRKGLITDWEGSEDKEGLLYQTDGYYTVIKVELNRRD